MRACRVTLIKAFPFRQTGIIESLTNIKIERNRIMEIVGIICIGIGVIIGLFFGIQLLIKAFNVSVLWGLGSIFVPFVGLIFVIMHWEQAKSPFLKSLIAIPFYIIGMALMASGVDVDAYDTGQ